MALNGTERLALLGGSELYDELSGALDERTLRILAHRRRHAHAHRRGWLVRRMLLLADLIALTLAFLLAQYLNAGASGAFVDRVSPLGETLLFLLTLPAWVVAAKVYGLYERDEERTDHSTMDDLVGVFHLVTVGAWLLFAGTWLTHVVEPNLRKILTFWMLAILLLVLARASARTYCRRQLAYLQNTVIVGAGEVGQLLAHKFRQHPEYGINLLGFVDSDPKHCRADLGHVPLLGSPERLAGLVCAFDIERVVIAFSNDSHEQSLTVIRLLKELDVQVDIVPRLFELLGPNLDVYTVEGVPLVGLRPPRLSHSVLLLKRTLDIVASATALVALAPLFAAIAWRIKVDSPGPVFFRQVRMGAGEKTFSIYKFRTMVLDADEQKASFMHLNKHARNGGDPRMFKILDDPRVTKFGCFLRRYSLDELPQLINVLRGQMSFVGPRPLILEEDYSVVDWARTRLDVKPGLTGPWQVLGRSDIPFDEMLKLDYLYVSNWSLFGDLKLIAQTVPRVFVSQHGAY